MKIYVSHASGMEKEIYEHLRNLKEFDFVFPHLSKAKNSKDLIRSCDAMIADVSVPSHGVGIEIGWSESFNIPIILISKKGSKISSSLKFVSNKFIEYKKLEDAIPKIRKALVDLE